MLPTRKRFELLKKTVVSLIEKCDNIENIQLMCRFDDDDFETYSIFKKWVNDIYPNVNKKIIIGYKYTYKLIHEYWNEMAQYADGDWLLHFNDDMVMETEGLDKEIKKFDGKFLLLVNRESNRPNFFFPSAGCLPKKWVEVVGWLAKEKRNDEWTRDLAEELGIIEEGGYTIYHDRYDLTGNNKDETYESGRDQNWSKDGKKDREYWSDENKKIRSRDLEFLKKYLELR